MLKPHDTITFSKKIESLVRDNEMSYLEAILFYVEETGIEYNNVKKLCNQSIIDNLLEEANELNLLGSRPKALPFID